VATGVAERRSNRESKRKRHNGEKLTQTQMKGNLILANLGSA
jgi:hypothetical protein